MEKRLNVANGAINNPQISCGHLFLFILPVPVNKMLIYMMSVVLVSVFVNCSSGCPQLRCLTIDFRLVLSKNTNVFQILDTEYLKENGTI